MQSASGLEVGKVVYILTFVLAVAADITSYLICKWLDSQI